MFCLYLAPPQGAQWRRSRRRWQRGPWWGRPGATRGFSSCPAPPSTPRHRVTWSPTYPQPTPPPTTLINELDKTLFPTLFCRSNLIYQKSGLREGPKKSKVLLFSWDQPILCFSRVSRAHISTIFKVFQKMVGHYTSSYIKYTCWRGWWRCRCSPAPWPPARTAELVGSRRRDRSSRWTWSGCRRGCNCQSGHNLSMRSFFLLPNIILVFLSSLRDLLSVQKGH